MAPNKFEKHIKKQLKEREISPSKEAWNKLSKQLDESGGQEKKSYFWYAIAASVIGLLLVSVFYLNWIESPLNSSIQVVETPVVEDQEEETKKEFKEVEKPIEVVTYEALEVPKVKSEVIEIATIPDSSKMVTSLEGVKPEEEVLALNENAEEIIRTKVMEVIAQVDLLEETKNDLTEAEVDSLLRMAQKEILTEKLFNGDRSVDAMALLTEVENELDKSFRDQIFESLKTGFLKVRTAVADRNN
jgi:hypothetical protein